MGACCGKSAEDGGGMDGEGFFEEGYYEEGGGGGQVGAGLGPERDFRDRIAAAGPDTLVVIRFFKEDCEKCASIGDFYRGLVAKYPQAIFLDARLNRNVHVVGALSVDSVPTFIAFKGHREISRYAGTNAQELLDLITSSL